MIKTVRIAAVVAMFVPALASANVDRGVVTTHKISPAAAARYWTYTTGFALTVANGSIAYLYYPHAAGARLVDVVVQQFSAGVGGTSYTVDVKNSAGTSLLTTTATATLASGADKVVDAKGDIALPSGWTRPVIKTDSTAVVSKGSKITIATVETGSYSTHAGVVATLVFEPLQ